MESTKQWLERITKEFALSNFGITVNVKFTNSIKRWGCCHTSVKLITFSNQFVEANDNNYELLRALAIHECCHLKEQNHGRKFKDLLLKFGIDSNHTNKLGIEINRPEPSKYYIYECINCHREIEKMIRYKGVRACGVCCDNYNNGRYDSKFNIRLVRKVEK